MDAVGSTISESFLRYLLTSWLSSSGFLSVLVSVLFRHLRRLQKKLSIDVVWKQFFARGVHSNVRERLAMFISNRCVPAYLELRLSFMANVVVVFKNLC